MLGRLLILFIGIPLIELYLFYEIGSRIGVPATIATVVLTGILGAALTKRQGLQVLSRYQKALAEGRMPHVEVIEGLMILCAGAVLLTPGFLTDVIGFALLIPPVRTAVRKLAARFLKDRVQVNVSGTGMGSGMNMGGGFPGATPPPSGPDFGNAPSRPTSKPPLDGPVIDVDAEVEVDTGKDHA